MTPAELKPVAWMHPDGRVIPGSTMATALKDGGAIKASVSGYTIPLFTEDQVRTAVAQERERCATAFETEAETWDEMRRNGYLGAIKRKGAAAIRRGE